MNYNILKRTNLLFYISAFIIISLAAIINGFPLWYPDTSTYLASGFELETPADRPIGYGIFILLTSLNGASVWLVVVAQAIIIFYLLNLTFYYFFSNWTKSKTLIVFTLLSLFSSFSFVSSQLISDIFSPIGAICLFHLFLNHTLKKSTRNWLIGIYILSVVMHMSHVGINIILIVILSILSKIRFNQFEFRKSIAFVILTLTCLLSMGSALGKSTHVFLMARLSENGILKKYLDENCDKKTYKICAFKNDLPGSANAFLWEKYSPVYHTGGWVDSKPEYVEIIKGTFSSWEYLALHLKESFKTTKRQLQFFEVGDGNIAYREGTSLYERFEKYFPREFNQYKNSIIYQTEDELMLDHFSKINSIHYFIALLALLINFLFLVFYKNKKDIFYWFVIFLIATILVSNFLNASLVVNAHRFGAKVSWLLLLSAILILFKLKKTPRNI
ncbi:MAG: hypothetical protein AB8F94_07500 [Saprospiraceae bacterium]